MVNSVTAVRKSFVRLGLFVFPSTPWQAKGVLGTTVTVVTFVCILKDRGSI